MYQLAWATGKQGKQEPKDYAVKEQSNGNKDEASHIEKFLHHHYSNKPSPMFVKMTVMQ